MWTMVGAEGDDDGRFCQRGLILFCQVASNGRGRWTSVVGGSKVPSVGGFPGETYESGTRILVRNHFEA